MNNKGFTLLEVLIAVFILALMAMMIWQITNNSYRGTEKASQYDDIYQYGRVALSKLEADLSQAFLPGPTGIPPIETSFKGEDQGDSDTANFISFSNVRMIKDEKVSDQIEVGYSISNCPDTEEKIGCLMRRTSAVIDKDVKEGGKSYPIAEGIKSFNLEYYDAVKQEWVGSWSSEDPANPNKLPRAVKIALSFNDPKKEGEEITFSTAVMIPLSLAAVEF